MRPQSPDRSSPPAAIEAGWLTFGIFARRGGSGWLLGCDRRAPLSSLSLAFPPLRGLPASNTQREHLVAVEGAPDALTREVSSPLAYPDGTPQPDPCGPPDVVFVGGDDLTLEAAERLARVILAAVAEARS